MNRNFFNFSSPTFVIISIASLTEVKHVPSRYSEQETVAVKNKTISIPKRNFKAVKQVEMI